MKIPGKIKYTKHGTHNKTASLARTGEVVLVSRIIP